MYKYSEDDIEKTLKEIINTLQKAADNQKEQKEPNKLLKELCSDQKDLTSSDTKVKMIVIDSIGSLNK